MRTYQLHLLESEVQFENLVVAICQDLLGLGVTSFSIGKDGGRDARFEGTAQKYPSSADPWKGKFVIQAKWTRNPIASCADSDFKKELSKETSNAQKLIEDGELDNYLLFTNRKMSGIADKELVSKLRTAIPLKTADILGAETIESQLRRLPPLVKQFKLAVSYAPLEIVYDDLRSLVQDFSAFSAKQSSKRREDTDPEDEHFVYVKTSTKNELNNLSQDYFDNVVAAHEPYFGTIERFFSLPENADLITAYKNTADEVRTRLQANNDMLETFEDGLLALYTQAIETDDGLRARRHLLNIFISYMYVHCDIGKKE
jgi:hypothetical protein